MSKVNFENLNKLDIRFKEFKIGNEIGYYIESEEIRYYIGISKNKMNNLILDIKRTQDKGYVIMKDNKYYISQFAYELILMKIYNNKYSREILNKYINKNYNSNKKVYRPKERGVKPIVSDELIFRVRDNEILISTKSISNKLNINHTELFNKCDREYLFNKDNLMPLTKTKRRKTTSYAINEKLYNKFVGIKDKEIEELYRKI